MATLNDLRKYIGYEFSSGPYTGKDYLSFQTKYINYLRSLCRENGWELANIIRGHYYFDVFIKNAENKYINLIVSDVRGYKPEWYYHVLIRTAKDEKDYHGGSNHYTSLDDLQESLTRLFDYA